MCKCVHSNEKQKFFVSFLDITFRQYPYYFVSEKNSFTVIAFQHEQIRPETLFQLLSFLL